MPIFDTHCHYNLNPLVDMPDVYLKAAQQAGVAGAVVVGTNTYSNREALRLRQKYPDYFRASLGLHPENVEELWHHNGQNVEQTRRALTSELSELATITSITEFDAWGEIGLDFFHADKKSGDFATLKQLQLELLQSQLEFAGADKRPIILHVRDQDLDVDSSESAYHLILQTIKEMKLEQKTLIFHCFSGSEAYLKQVLELPHAYVSFAGNLTFKSAHELRALAKMVPAERLLLETDAPFLSPEPCRGQFCQPEFIKHTAELAHEQLGVDLEQVYRNSVAIFGENKL